MLCTSFMNNHYVQPKDGSNQMPPPPRSEAQAPPPMPAGVSLADRTISLPEGGLARRNPTYAARSVSFSDSVTFNFPAPASPGQQFPGRIVSQVTRKSSIESLQDLFGSSISSFDLDDNMMVKPSADSSDHFLEPNELFANGESKPAAFDTFSDGDLRTILHRACQQFPRRKAIVQGALKKDVSAVRRRAFIPGIPSKSNKGQRVPPEPYQLPINIALAHKASMDVLDLLVRADASQLAEKDGIHGANSLCLALEQRPNDIAVLGMFLVSNPQLATKPCDNNNNTPLHVACQRGSNLPIIRQLFQLYPPALFHRNESYKTPIDILQQQVQVCPKAKASLQFLQEKVALYQKQQLKCQGPDMFAPF